MPYKPSRREVLAAVTAAAACGGPEMPVQIPGAAIPRSLPPYSQNPTYHQQPSSSPIHLSGSVLLRSGATGGPPIAAFKNPTGQDMELLEMKFEVSGPITQTNTTLNFQAYGSSVSGQLMYGTEQLTNGSVPLWNFGRQENPLAETKVDNQYTTVFNSYTWRLPRPLYVPAGAVIIPTFTHTGLTSSALNVRVGYSGRTIFKKPKNVFLPWVASYSSPAFSPASSAGSAQSSELDLVNPFDQPLNLQRFVGRIQGVDVNGNVVDETTSSLIANQYLMARMNDSYGRAIVRNYVPFSSVFSPVTRSWEMSNGARLDPNSYYRLFLNKLVSPSDVVAFNPNALAQFQVLASMVGWRKVVAS